VAWVASEESVEVELHMVCVSQSQMITRDRSVVFRARFRLTIVGPFSLVRIISTAISESNDLT
jgi:hypothetical protein